MEKQFYKEEFAKFCFGLVATAIGVLIALTVNNWNDSKKDDERYENMLIAIKAEALLNYDIWEDSFNVYANNDSIDIKNEFTSKISEEFLKSDIFLSHTDQNSISRLTKYILNLKKANTFKTADQKYKSEKKFNDKNYSSELKNFRSAFNSTLKDCESSILLMAKLKDDTSNHR